MWTVIKNNGIASNFVLESSLVNNEQVNFILCYGLVMSPSAGQVMNRWHTYTYWVHDKIIKSSNNEFRFARINPKVAIRSAQSRFWIITMNSTHIDFEK